MECKNYKPFVVKPKTKHKPKIKSKTKLETRGLSRENKMKLDIIYAKVLLRQVKKSLGF